MAVFNSGNDTVSQVFRYGGSDGASNGHRNTPSPTLYRSFSWGSSFFGGNTGSETFSGNGSNGGIFSNNQHDNSCNSQGPCSTTCTLSIGG